MLLAAFVWGMVPAVILSVMLEAGVGGPGGDAAGSLFADAGVAPIIEESVKGLALLLFMVFAYRELDDVLDGIIYGAMIGFGFAFTENILYVVGSSAEDGLGVAMFVLFLRTVIFGANHAFFTGVLGAGVGAARLMRGRLPRIVVLGIAWVLAVFFHGVHNAGAALTESTNLVSLGVSFCRTGAVSSACWCWWRWCGVRRSSGSSAIWPSEVELGVLTPEEFSTVSSLSERQRTLAAVLRRDGRAAYRRLARIYVLLTELALKKQQLHALGDERGNTALIERLRADIAHLRAPDAA